ncbi:MAG: acyl-CoA dehydrogenase family protein [Myxococcales bacterium]
MENALTSSILETYLASWAQRERDAVEAGESRLPGPTVREFRSSGVLALPVPQALGGAGQDLWRTSELIRNVAREAPSTALCLAMPLGNAGNSRLVPECVSPSLRGQLEQGRRWIARKALSGAILAVANSEPGSGGDLSATRTVARRDGEGALRLSGEKSFATLGQDADYFLCSARTEDGSIDAFFVPRKAPGVRVFDDWDALGMRATASVGLSLEDVRAETVFVYPGAISGISARHWSTLLLAALFVGIGEGALAAAVECAPKTSEWARSSLAECALQLDAAHGFVEHLARSEQIPCSSRYVERCRRAKTFAAQVALECATRAVVVAGGRSYRPQHPLARLLLDAVAGPLLRPPLPQAMDGIAAQLFGS